MSEDISDVEKRLRKLEQPKWALYISIISPLLVIIGMAFGPLWNNISLKVDQKDFDKHTEISIERLSKMGDKIEKNKDIMYSLHSDEIAEEK